MVEGLGTRAERGTCMKNTEKRPIYEDIEQAMRTLAERGEIYDTGERRCSDRTKSHQIVWACVPPRAQQS